MPRGKTADVGDTMVNVLGYHNTRTEDGWRLTHHIVAEEKLGRSLTDSDMVRFVDGDRNNLKPENIEVIKKNVASLRRQKARLEANIEDMQERLAEINKELEAKS